MLLLKVGMGHWDISGLHELLPSSCVEATETAGLTAVHAITQTDGGAGCLAVIEQPWLERQELHDPSFAL